MVLNRYNDVFYRLPMVEELPTIDPWDCYVIVYRECTCCGAEREYSFSMDRIVWC